MIYLITQLAGFLLLALASAALVGWVYGATKSMPARARRRHERDGLVRDLRALAAGDAPQPVGPDPELSALRSRVAIEAARAAEAERGLEAARARAEEATGHAAELQRRLELQTPTEREIIPDDAVVVQATPIISDETTLQAWRLRYFEQRVRYLENSAPQPPDPSPPAEDRRPLWRARVAEARAAHLEDELRDVERTSRMALPLAAPAPEPPQEQEVAAFAADPETDALLRWRMLYLERRVAHLQAEAAAAAAAPEPEPVNVQPPAPPPGPDPELWKWRARYLEARLRHLEARAPVATSAPLAALPDAEIEADSPPVESPIIAPEPLRVAAERPATLPGPRGGAPDDLTLIDGVSLLQQSTLYSLGVFHFDQVAAWTPENVAWVDRYLRLRGRIAHEEWVEQAQDMAREGVLAARRVLEDEDA